MLCIANGYMMRQRHCYLRRSTLSLSLFDSLTAAYSQSHSQVQFTLGSHHHVVYLYINASEERKKKQNEILYV